MSSEEQASLWAARCEASQLGEADRISLEAWLAENPAHGVLLAEYRRLSEILRCELPALAAAGSAALPTSPAPVHARPHLSPGWIFGALGAAAALTVALWYGHEAVRPELVATAAGQRRTVVLADGTRVDLNAGTSLLMADGRRERRVRLQKGEAFFAVAKDHGRPFLVDTPGGSVRVTGTKFDVCSEIPSELEVTVAEGSVQVRAAAGRGRGEGAPVLLKAGDHFSSDSPDRAQKLSPGGVEDALAWREGQVVFDGVPLRKALARFAYYDGRNLSADPDVADLRVSSRFNLDDLDGFLAALEVGLPVRVRHDPSGAIRVVRANTP